ncbi:alpha-amylase family glycosyl hydrolase [Chlorobium phaeovibrioides]|uniref:alpha-amylase family glycosyl hydrolase n=1 Tax=Chlorobium phaeovibrioides TaxID=1094 RepID=UPI001230A53C|nr:alpha-amylase [Chlorobium phaeovibrioides]QEQ57107.1 alpha-amylase [Chlorobium phaeovibrioides]
METTSTIELLLNQLKALQSSSASYLVPNIWNSEETGASLQSPAPWFIGRIEEILQTGASTSASTFPENWHKDTVVYNLFVRFGTAFDHNGDGSISEKPLPEGFRETGTLLKAIALLPYIKKLGANTVYLLPLTEIGTANRKGSLGSPYAIKDPMKLDPMLAEPALDLSPEILLKAFVEAAHLLGMRVVLEFVFRTAATDSNWIEKHPDWFYWLKNDVPAASYGPPQFDQDTLNRIFSQVDRHELAYLPAPTEAFKEQFAPHPITVTKTNEGIQATDANGEACRIASAFSDWPPDDRQPAWTDVTYLKMHRPEEFNYIAYNTIRMYDEALNDPESFNTGLWNEISSIIPRFQEEYGIDGAMMDMGHALPPLLKKTIVEKARATRPDFLFWDENFNPTSEIRDEGFNAVFGSLPFVINDIIYIRGLLNFLNKTGVALPFFGTGENHNTPRVPFRFPKEAAGRNYSAFIFTLAAILPTLPFIQSGMEVSEWHPVNLGLNFTDEDRTNFPPETLPLFSPAAIDWKETNTLPPLTSYIQKIIAIRSQYLDTILSGDAGSIGIPYVSHEQLFAIKRTAEGRSLLFIGNSNMHEPITGGLEFGMKTGVLEDLISRKPHSIVNHRLEATFQPGECMLFLLPTEN